MLFCPKCQQLEATTPQKNSDGTVTYLCRKCGGVMPLRRDLRPGEIVAGFEIEEELGRGAMGIVYQARQTNLDREVAIKILSDDSASDEMYVERFFREARAAASLSHPNVVQAYDAGVTKDGIYYFVMEKVTGENLELVLNNVGPLNIPQALDVFISVANALSYAWTRNQLSHGDIKPENIIMRLNGKVKLADFGLARRAKDPELADEDIRATPAYAPPEIIQGDKSVPGFKSDMYSFGATAYHILIGHEPFVGTDPMKVCEMQLSEIQTPLSELNPNIPQRLSDLVDTLMKKDPAERPAAWSDVVDELKSIRDELNGVSGLENGDDAETDGVSMSQVLKKRSVMVTLAVVLLLVIAVAAVAVWMASNPGGETGGIPSPGGSLSGPAGSVSKPGSAPVRDEAFFQARWKMILERSKTSAPELKEVEQFVEEAGKKAPAEAVAMLESLRASEKQIRALTLRNELLDQAASFNPEEAKKLDFEALNELCQSAQSKRDELKKLDSTLKEHVFLPEQQKTVDAYVKRLADLQLAVSLGGDLSTGSVASDSSGKTKVTEPKQTGAASERNETASAETKPAEDVTGTVKDSKLLMNYLLLLDSLPNAIKGESGNFYLSAQDERADALRILNELLADKAFTDEIPRKNCLAIRNFLVTNSAPLLPYLVADKAVLRGMKLFPHAYPDSIVEDITDSVFRLKVPDQKASIIQRVPWNQLRRDEGEDQIVVSLVNTPQLAKLSENFREYLYVRAVFLGVDPDLLRKRYDRASGLPEEKREELARTAGFFRKSVLDEED